MFNNPDLINKFDPTNSYLIVAQSDEENVSYYGYMNVRGNWYIMKNDLIEKTYKYYTNSEDFTFNWGKRIELTYKFPNEVNFQ